MNKMVINIKRATHARSISNKIHYLGLCAHINLCVNIVKQNTSADERDEVYTLTADGWDGEPSFIVTFSNKKRQCLNDNGTGALAAFKTYDPRGNIWMDVFVHSTLNVCSSSWHQYRRRRTSREREGTIKIKRYGKWNGKFNSVQQRCCVPLAFLSSAHDLIFHQRHKTRRTRRGSSRQEIKVPTSDD